MQNALRHSVNTFTREAVLLILMGGGEVELNTFAELKDLCFVQQVGEMKYNGIIASEKKKNKNCAYFTFFKESERSFIHLRSQLKSISEFLAKPKSH